MGRRLCGRRAPWGPANEFAPLRPVGHVSAFADTNFEASAKADARRSERPIGAVSTAGPLSAAGSQARSRGGGAPSSGPAGSDPATGSVPRPAGTGRAGRAGRPARSSAPHSGRVMLTVALPFSFPVLSTT